MLYSQRRQVAPVPLQLLLVQQHLELLLPHPSLHPSPLLPLQLPLRAASSLSSVASSFSARASAVASSQSSACLKCRQLRRCCRIERLKLGCGGRYERCRYTSIRGARCWYCGCWTARCCCVAVRAERRLTEIHERRNEQRLSMDALVVSSASMDCAILHDDNCRSITLQTTFSESIQGWHRCASFLNSYVSHATDVY